jgi:hypothetical protein
MHSLDYNASRKVRDNRYSSHTKHTTDREKPGRDTSRSSTRERTYRGRDPDATSDVSSSNSKPSYCSTEGMPYQRHGLARNPSSRNDSGVALANHERRYAGKGEGIERSKYS